MYAASHWAHGMDEDELRHDMEEARARKEPRSRQYYRYSVVKRNPGAVGRCEAFHGEDACDDVTETRLWMPGPIVLMGACIDCGYNVTNSRSKKDGRYVHDHEDGVKLYRRAEDGEQPSKTLSPPSQVFVLGNWLGCTYDDGTGKRELNGSSRIKACTDNGKRLFAIHSTKGCLYVISGGSFRIRDWMYD